MRQQILTIPGVEYFGSWELLQGFLESRGNPPWRCENNIDLSYTKIEHLNNLVSVSGDLYLRKTPIESLGSLQSVDGDLDLYETPIKSLGSLQSVGGYLYLGGTPLAKKYNEQQIRRTVDVKRAVYL